MLKVISTREPLQSSWLEAGAPTGPAPTVRAAEIHRLLAAASDVVERALSENSDDYLHALRQRGGE